MHTAEDRIALMKRALDEQVEGVSVDVVARDTVCLTVGALSLDATIESGGASAPWGVHPQSLTGWFDAEDNEHPLGAEEHDIAVMLIARYMRADGTEVVVLDD